MGYEEDFADLLSRRSSGEITAEQFRELRDKLTATAPKAPGRPVLHGARTDAGMPVSRSRPRSRAKTVFTFVAVLAVLGSIFVGLSLGGFFQFKQSFAQWISTSRPEILAMADQMRGIDHAVRLSSLSQLRAHAATLVNEASHLDASNCPVKPIATDLHAIDLDATGISTVLAQRFTNASQRVLLGRMVRLDDNLSHLNADLSAALLSAAGASGANTTTSLGPGARAAVVACISDAKNVQLAAAVYDAQIAPPLARETNITPGDPATYPKGTGARLILHNGLIESWPSANHGYSISLSQDVAGFVAVYVPANSKHPVDFETETSSTGCNAL